MMELLFKRILPSKSRHYRDGKVLMSRGSIKTQRIPRLASYLGKQVDQDYVALDGFNGDFSKEER